MQEERLRTIGKYMLIAPFAIVVILILGFAFYLAPWASLGAVILGIYLVVAIGLSNWGAHDKE